MDRVDNSVSSTGTGPVFQAGAVHGDVHLHGGVAPVRVPRQLPPSTRHFVGRETELRALTALLDETTVGAATTCVVDGPPGVGKTALAVRWAHLVADRFPDGQLHLDLHGFDHRRPPVTPDQAVRMALEALLGPGAAAPDDLAARTALLRSTAADRRLLFVVDNAGDADQVSPVLPGSAACFVLVTSRERLDGLVLHHGAHRLNLAPLTDEESRLLIGSYVGPIRATERAAVDGLVRRCARLPLALGVVAARAAAEPAPVNRVGDSVRWAV